VRRIHRHAPEEASAALQLPQLQGLALRASVLVGPVATELLRVIPLARP